MTLLQQKQVSRAWKKRLKNHRSRKRKHDNHHSDNRKRACLFLLFAKFIFDNFIVVGEVQVAVFSAFFPAGVLVAPAVGAEGRAFFQFGVAVWTEHDGVGCGLWGRACGPLGYGV